MNKKTKIGLGIAGAVAVLAAAGVKLYNKFVKSNESEVVECDYTELPTEDVEVEDVTNDVE